MLQLTRRKFSSTSSVISGHSPPFRPSVNCQLPQKYFKLLHFHAQCWELLKHLNGQPRKSSSDFFWIKRTFQRAIGILILLLLFSLLCYHIFFSINNNTFTLPWFLAFSCESWFTYTWIVNIKWSPAVTKTYPNRLLQRILTIFGLSLTTTNPMKRASFICCGKYTLTGHRFKLTLIDRTIWTKVEESLIPSNHFDFVSFKDVLDSDREDKYLDVIGHVVERDEIKDKEINGPKSKLFDITLEDSE